MDLSCNPRAAIGDNSGARTRCIFRAHGDRSYTKLRNAFLQDRRLSDEARGLIARLLSLPDDWEVTVQSIIASGKAGRDKVYRMLKEAEDLGYIKPDDRERGSGGKLGRQLYFVTDDPQSLIEMAAREILEIEAAIQPRTENPDMVEKRANEPCPDKPDTVLPDMVEVVGNQGATPLPENPDVASQQQPGKPDTANPTGKRNIDNKNTPPIVPHPDEQEKRKRSVVPDEYPHDFEEFWKVYPRREGKAAACRVWERLKMPQKRRAYVALKSQLPVLSAKTRDPRGNFCPLPATWIGQGRFDDEPSAETDQQRNTHRSFAQQREDAERAALDRDVEQIRKRGPAMPLYDQLPEELETFRQLRPIEL